LKVNFLIIFLNIIFYLGCGCEYTQYGCCGDKNTPALDETKNCSCEASKYGCCLDGITESKGENFEGCPSKPILPGGNYITINY